MFLSDLGWTTGGTVIFLMLHVLVQPMQVRDVFKPLAPCARSCDQDLGWCDSLARDGTCQVEEHSHDILPLTS